MADEPTPRQNVARQLAEWITGISTLWQLCIFLIIGLSLLVGTLLYQHPEWITMILQAGLGSPP